SSMLPLSLTWQGIDELTIRTSNSTISQSDPRRAFKGASGPLPPRKGGLARDVYGPSRGLSSPSSSFSDDRIVPLFLSYPFPYSLWKLKEGPSVGSSFRIMLD
ncbi:MAG: hypothetical protein EBS79_14660, partial [Gammaproteobacteria bacterium]|nr:hypothetical protein [Gammaproteobacteria bacterium]